MIVSSDMPSTIKQDKGKAKATQEPIGTRGANFSPTAPRDTFTTDVGPDIIVPGGHYIKVMNIPVSEIGETLEVVYRAVSFAITAESSPPS